MTMLSPLPPKTPVTATPLPVLPQDDNGEPEAGSRWGQAHHILLLFFVGLVIFWILSGFYRVNANELAIVERLGQYVGDTTTGKAAVVEPGVRYSMPWPIDKVYKVPVQETRNLNVKAFSASADMYQEFKEGLQRKGAPPELIASLYDPYLITGDKNIVHIEIAVKYQIANPQSWITALSHEASSGKTDKRDEFFELFASHVLVQAISQIPVDRILFEGSERLPEILNTELKNAIKNMNDSDPLKQGEIDLGIDIQQVEVVNKRPPAIVKGAFEAVLQARSEKEILITQANIFRDGLIQRAQADRDNLKRRAEVYKKQVVEAARGEADRFKQVLTEFEKAPDITRQRLYSDTAREVMAGAKRIFWVAPGQKTIITIDEPGFDANKNQQPK